MTPALPGLLRDRLAGTAATTLCVGFSGGPDSTALLHALAQLPEARARSLRSLHVDHGIHPQSHAWAEHCADLCRKLSVPCTVVRVDARDTRREGIEAAARRARYGAFARHLQADEWLALAHHRDDQIETVLLKLLRGAGPEGLAGMRRLRPFAEGWLWRPLLDVARDGLRAYVVANRLEVIEDPANADPRFARNALRAEILPLLQRHWPRAGAAILHSARLCRGAADRLADEARTLLATVQHGDGTPRAADWLTLPEALRGLVLDRWLHGAGLPAPADAARGELERQLRDARADANPRVRWAGAEVRAWNGRLFALPPLVDPPAGWSAAWDGSTLALPDDCGGLSLVHASGSGADARIDPPLTIRFRQGGERIRPVGSPHLRELRDLFQQARIPPWLRNRCPLLHRDGELVAVADLWRNARGERTFQSIAARPRWTRPAWARAIESAVGPRASRPR